MMVPRSGKGPDPITKGTHMSATYASILGALASETPLTYGGLTRSERMHVQSMRRDDLVAVLDASGVVLESLDASDPSVKSTWAIRLTVRGREVARALAPFATGAPVVGKPESSKPRHAAPKGETCGAITRKGTPCGARISSSTGACSLVPAHGGPVTVTRVESAPAPVVESAPALDVDAIARALAGILAGAR